MLKLVQFSDGTDLYFDDGQFDSYRVSFYRNGRHIHSPTDIDIFNDLLAIGDNEQAMKAVEQIARQIGKATSFNQVALPIVNGTLKERKLFSVLAAMMMAEERKDGTKIGKIVKLVGCNQVLREGYSPEWAASWSKMRSAHEIKRRAKLRGLIDVPKQLSLIKESWQGE